MLIASNNPPAPTVLTPSVHKLAVKPLLPKTPSVLLRIASCESGNDAYAKNPYSSASGRFQITQETWDTYSYVVWGSRAKEHNIFDYEDNTKVAEALYKYQGTVPWKASAYCWK